MVDDSIHRKTNHKPHECHGMQISSYERLWSSECGVSLVYHDIGTAVELPDHSGRKALLKNSQCKKRTVLHIHEKALPQKKFSNIWGSTGCKNPQGQISQRYFALGEKPTVCEISGCHQANIPTTVMEMAEHHKQQRSSARV